MGRAVAGQTKTFGIELASVANAGKFQINPTLDAADFRISINGGAFAALTNTPTVSPSGGAQVVVVLAAAETTSAGAGGRIHLRCSDSSGNEWQDVACEIEVFATAEDTLVATVTNLTNAPTNGDLTATMKTSVTTAATAATPALSSAGVQAIWDKLTSGLTAAGSIGKLLIDNINTTISSRSNHTAADVRTEIDNNSTQLAKLGTPTGASVSADIAAVKSETAAILTDTGTDGVVVAGGSKTGYTLVNDQSSVVIGTVNALGTQAKTDVNNEVLDVLNVDTFGESSAVPGATSSLIDKIKWLFTISRNKITQTATTQTLRNDADNGNIATNPTSDNGTTMTRGKWS